MKESKRETFPVRVPTTKALKKYEGPSVTSVRPPAPTSYHVYVRPKPPRAMIGSLYTAKRTQNAEIATCTTGVVMSIGELAWNVKAGELDPTKDPVSQAIKPGTWVHYRQNAGQKLRIRRAGGDATSALDEDSIQFVLVMADTDILGVFDDEAHANEFGDWA